MRLDTAHHEAKCRANVTKCLTSHAALCHTISCTSPFYQLARAAHPWYYNAQQSYPPPWTPPFTTKNCLKKTPSDST